jgi:cellulose 1,4-beta-cellobiosidase
MPTGTSNQHMSQANNYCQGNVEGWAPSANDQNAGVGGHGSCCAEMDIWEANSVSTAVTPHACSTIEQTRCDGDSCGGTYSADRYAGVCDADGCDFNSYRMGVKDFYGKGKTVDTSKKFTVVTQFIGTGSAMEASHFHTHSMRYILTWYLLVRRSSGSMYKAELCTHNLTPLSLV